MIIETTEIELLGVQSVAEAFRPNGGDALYNRVEAEVITLAKDCDITTEKGRKQIASLAYKVARTKTTFDSRGKEYVAQLKELPRMVDNERARMRTRFDALAATVRAPLDAFEAREKARVEGHRDAIARLNSNQYPMLRQNMLVEDYNLVLDELNTLFIDRDFEEFAETAANARETAIENVKQELAKAEARRAEYAKELERQEVERQKAMAEREERARRQAEEEAKQRYERQLAQAEREKQEVIEREAQAKRDAETFAARVEADKKAAAERFEREKQEAIQAERSRLERKERTSNYQLKVEAFAAMSDATDEEKKAFAAMVDYFYSLDRDGRFTPSEVAEAIADGLVPYVTMNQEVTQ